MNKRKIAAQRVERCEVCKGMSESFYWCGQKVIYDQHTPEEHTETLADLHRAASDPAKPAIFDEDEVRAINDPAEALAWIGRRKKAMEAWDAEESQPDRDPLKRSA